MDEAAREGRARPAGHWQAMQTYTVHEPPGGPTDRMERAERLVFVKDGFSLVAALFAPFWMLAHRLWLPLLIYLGALAGIELIVWALDLTQQVAGWITLGLHILVGLESDAIRRWTLARGGYRQIASVTGRGWNECERRFFDAWLAEQPFVAPTPREGGRSGAGRLSPLALGPGR